MSRKEHFKIMAAIILITSIAAVLKFINGWEILSFALLSLVGMYFSLFFVKYVYEQKNYTLDHQNEDDELMDSIDS